MSTAIDFEQLLHEPDEFEELTTIGEVPVVVRGGRCYVTVEADERCLDHVTTALASVGRRRSAAG